MFYKYLSDTFLTHVYDLLFNQKPESMAQAQAAYEEVSSTEDAEELLEDIKESYHYTIEPDLTYTKLSKAFLKALAEGFLVRIATAQRIRRYSCACIAPI